MTFLKKKTGFKNTENNAITCLCRRTVLLSLSQNSKVFHGILIRGGVVERYLAR